MTVLGAGIRFGKAVALLIVATLAAVAFSCEGSSRSSGDAAPNPPGRPNTPPAVVLSGDNAYAALTAQVGFGYRIPGTSAHKQCGDWIVSKFKEYGWEVTEQTFTKTVRGTTLPMRNIIARQGFISGSRDNVLIAAHWDTRPWADQDILANRNTPIQGANDGASGVAVLIELARVLSKNKPKVGVELVCFDGEDYGPELSAMFLGSEYFASQLSTAQASNIRFGILLDMIGDRDLKILPERSSENVAANVYRRIRDIAQALGYGAHFAGSPQQSIIDDHIPLIEKGIPTYDLIDFDYPYWHTVEDTPDKCSAESLGIVGNVMASLIWGEEAGAGG